MPNLPDLDFSVSLRVQPAISPEGFDMDIVIIRRAVGSENFAMQAKGAVNFNIGTIQYVAGSGGKIGIFADRVGVSASLDESGNITGASYGRGLGVEFSGALESSSNWTLFTGYTSFGCKSNEYMCGGE